MAQDILKKQLPAIKGLILTIDQYQTPVADCGVNQLHIFHCQSRAHWIAAPSIGSVASVNVYDSVFSSLDNYSKEVVSKHFPIRSIKMCHLQKQIGGKDYGLFAITVITAVAHGLDPSKYLFVQDKMRHHLNCLQNKNITPFPCIT